MTRKKIDPDSGQVRRMVKSYQAGRSLRELAALFGVPEANVRRRLHAAGVTMRTSAKRSRLRRCDQARLWSDLIDFGVDQTAKKRGVTGRTLQLYIARLRGGGKW